MLTDIAGSLFWAPVSVIICLFNRKTGKKNLFKLDILTQNGQKHEISVCKYKPL